MKETSANSTHAERPSKVIQNSVRTRLTVMVYCWSSCPGLLSHESLMKSLKMLLRWTKLLILLEQRRRLGLSGARNADFGFSAVTKHKTRQERVTVYAGVLTHPC